MSLEQYSDDPDEPTNYNDALSSQEGILWKKAVDEEYSSLIENGTWTLVPLPSNQVPIKCKWVFNIKPGHNEVAKGYKARLVAKGYSQRKGIDYKEIFGKTRFTSINPGHSKQRRPRHATTRYKSSVP